MLEPLLWIVQRDSKGGDEVKDTGAPIQVPVGPETLGRIVNVIGEPIDEKGQISN